MEDHTAGMNPKLYFKQHKNRRREAEFAQFLLRRLGAELVSESYLLSKTLEGCNLDVAHIVRLVERDSYLARAKQGQFIAALKQLPNEVRVITAITQISCDIVIDSGENAWFWEFHESQHRTLSVSRPTSIYRMDDSMIRVPRFVQRFLRDLWRIKYLPNFKIVWFDWFDSNAETFAPELTPGFEEFSLPQKFSFERLCGATSALGATIWR